MRNVLLVLLVPIMALSYEFSMPSISSMKEMAVKAKKAYEDHSAEDDGAKSDNAQSTSSGPSVRSTGAMLRIPANINSTFSSAHCTKVIKKNAYIACYEPELKISTMIHYEVYGDELRKGNIKKRPSFYDNRTLSSSSKAYSKDYTRSNYDRGHSRPHAATSYDRDLLYETYDMVNIWPQTPDVNRKTWIKAERYVRSIARKVGKVNVINIADIRRNHKTIGRGVTVPAGFYKIVYTDDSSFKRCFYYANEYLSSAEVKKDKLKQHLVDCGKIRI